MKPDSVSVLEAKLMESFPASIVGGAITPHDCLECDVLRRELGGVTWRDVPLAFVNEHEGDLPLLSEEAYAAFLPAWLLAGVRQPDGPVASMLMVNLRSDPNTSVFTAQQAAVVIDAAKFIAANSAFGADDPVHVESVAQIQRVWQPAATQQTVAADRAKPRSG